MQTVGELVQQSSSADELWWLGSGSGTEWILGCSLIDHGRAYD